MSNDEQPADKARRVAVCVPSHDLVHADFAMALAAMMQDPGAECILLNSKGSLVAINRNKAIEQAQEAGVDWALFLDSDMIFPPDTLHRLLRHGKDIVGGTYIKRSPPYGILGVPLNNEDIEVTTGIAEVAALPTGCLLINMRVFARLKRPYFRTPATEETDGVLPKIQGEDYYFCTTARAAGFKIWMDVDLSKMLGHIGQFVYKIQINQDGTVKAKPSKAETILP